MPMSKGNRICGVESDGAHGQRSIAVDPMPKFQGLAVPEVVAWPRFPGPLREMGNRFFGWFLGDLRESGYATIWRDSELR